LYYQYNTLLVYGGGGRSSRTLAVFSRQIPNSSRADKPLQKLFHTLWISKLSVSLPVVICLYVCASVCLNFF